MKFTIADSNTRCFAKAVQFLSRVGDELYLESSSTKLTIRTTNSTKSSFAVVTFHTGFFIEYDDTVYDAESEETKCKVSVKSFLVVLRNLKQIKECRFTLDVVLSKLIVQLTCGLDTVKTHSIRVLEFDSLQAFYSTNSYPNQIFSKYISFADIVNNFRTNEEEITFEVNKKSVIVKNYMDSAPINPRALRSQLNMSAQEFDKYQIEEDTSVTFCLREFRALLNLSESLRLDMSMNFETNGKPIVFILEWLDTFDVHLVLSTIRTETDSECSSLSNTKTISRVESMVRNESQNELPASKRTKRQKMNSITVDHDNSTIDPLRNQIKEIISQSKSIPFVPLENTATTVSNLGTQAPLIIRNTLTQRCNEIPINLDSEDIQIIFNEDTADIEKESSEIVDHNFNEKYEQFRTRTKFIFRRCFEPTFQTQNLPGACEILAEDSDAE